MPMQPLIEIQQGMAEVGRIRLGDKAPGNGAPRKLTTFRLTSANKLALDTAAALYGGTVRKWDGAPSEGQYELITTSTEIRVVIPPVPRLCSQFYETWSAGGCTRRCDGITEMISGDPCQCDPDDDPKTRCKLTTRVSVMLPELQSFGLWRLESHGWNAAKTLPGTVQLFAGTGKFIPAVLRAEQRTEKKNGQTRKFVVPVIDFPQFTLDKMLAAQPGLLIGHEPHEGRKVDRPELPAPTELPESNPSWKGDPSLPPPVDGAAPEYSKKCQSILDSLAPLKGEQVATFAHNMDKTIKTLSPEEQRVVNAQIDMKVM